MAEVFMDLAFVEVVCYLYTVNKIDSNINFDRKTILYAEDTVYH